MQSCSVRYNTYRTVPYTGSPTLQLHRRSHSRAFKSFLLLERCRDLQIRDDARGHDAVRPSRGGGGTGDGKMGRWGDTVSTVWMGCGIYGTVYMFIHTVLTYIHTQIQTNTTHLQTYRPDRPCDTAATAGPVCQSASARQHEQAASHHHLSAGSSAEASGKGAVAPPQNQTVAAANLAAAAPSSLSPFFAPFHSSILPFSHSPVLPRPSPFPSPARRRGHPTALCDPPPRGAGGPAPIYSILRAHDDEPPPPTRRRRPLVFVFVSLRCGGCLHDRHECLIHHLCTLDLSTTWRSAKARRPTPLPCDPRQPSFFFLHDTTLSLLLLLLLLLLLRLLPQLLTITITAAAATTTTTTIATTTTITITTTTTITITITTTTTTTTTLTTTTTTTTTTLFPPRDSLPPNVEHLAALAALGMTRLAGQPHDCSNRRLIHEKPAPTI